MKLSKTLIFTGLNIHGKFALLFFKEKVKKYNLVVKWANGGKIIWLKLTDLNKIKIFISLKKNPILPPIYT